jgi:hypothetical protein
MRHIIFHTSSSFIVLISVCAIVLCSENGKQHFRKKSAIFQDRVDQKHQFEALTYLHRSISYDW